MSTVESSFRKWGSALTPALLVVWLVAAVAAGTSAYAFGGFFYMITVLGCSTGLATGLAFGWLTFPYYMRARDNALARAAMRLRVEQEEMYRQWRASEPRPTDTLDIVVTALWSLVTAGPVVVIGWVVDRPWPELLAAPGLLLAIAMLAATEGRLAGIVESEKIYQDLADSNQDDE